MGKVRSPLNAALRVSVTYAAVASLWIVLSDRLVAPFTGRADDFVQTYKGLAFVVVTAVMLYSLVSRYVSRQANAREETERRERNWRALFLNNPNPMWVTARDSMAFLAVNEMAIEKYGWSGEEFGRMTLVDVHAPEEHARLLDRTAQTDGYDYYQGVWKHVAKDGRTLDMEVTSHSIEFDGIRAELVVLSDLTPRLDAQERERESRRLFETMFETAPVAIVVVDREGIVRMWNPMASQVFGWTAAEVIGRFDPVVTPENVQVFKRSVIDVFEGGTMPPMEEACLRADGNRVEVASYHAPLSDSQGRVMAVLGMFIDVSERAAAERELTRYREHLEEMVHDRTAELERVNEELAEATRIKGDFLASMSHELRTPLNAVIGFSGVLLEQLSGPLNEGQREQVNMIREAGRHLLALINDVLDLSKIEAGQVPLSLRELEISDVVDEAARLVEPLLQNKGLEFGRQLDASALVVADPIRLKQIVMNLLDNAIRYTDEGHVRVSLEVKDNMALVSVEDSGIGIAREDQELIFDEFRQVDRNGVNRPGGTGLGLAIARKLSRMMSGDVTVESEPGAGSTFVLSVPCASAGCETGDR